MPTDGGFCGNANLTLACILSTPAEQILCDPTNSSLACLARGIKFFDNVWTFKRMLVVGSVLSMISNMLIICAYHVGIGSKRHPAGVLLQRRCEVFFNLIIQSPDLSLPIVTVIFCSASSSALASQLNGNIHIPTSIHPCCFMT